MASPGSPYPSRGTFMMTGKPGSTSGVTRTMVPMPPLWSRSPMRYPSSHSPSAGSPSTVHSPFCSRTASRSGRPASRIFWAAPAQS